MAVIGEAFVAVRPETSGFQKETESSVLDSVKSIATKAAVILGGVVLFEKLKTGIEDAVTAFQNQASIGRLTDAVIKSMGNSANVTAEDVRGLADAQAALTGIEADQVQHAENVLLTFRNIRNEAGKGNDIFNQATVATENLSVALGEDLQSSAIRIGKALNDPISGVTALRRVGVQLTDQQKEQIQAFVDAGNVMGAQKVILQELGAEFGNAAAAAADPVKRLQAIVLQAKETVGAALFPLAASIADQLGAVLPVLATTVASALQSVVGDFLAPLIKTLTPLLQQLIPILAPVIQAIGAGLAPIGAAIAAVFTQLGPAIVPIARLIGDLLTLVGQLGVIFAPLLAPLVQGFTIIATILDQTLVPVVLALADAFQPLIGPIISALQSVFVALTPIILALVAAFKPLIGPILTAMEAVFTTLTPIVVQFAGILGQLLLQAVQAIAPILVQLAPIFSRLLDVLVRVGESIGQTAFIVFVDVLRALLRIVEPLLPIIIKFADAFGDQLGKALEKLAPSLNLLITTLGGALVRILDQIGPQLPQLADAFVQIALANLQLTLALTPLIPPLTKLAVLILNNITVPLLTLWAKAFATVATVISTVSLAVTKLAGGALGAVAREVASLIQAVLNLDGAKVGAFFDAILTGAQQALDGLVQFFTDLPGKVFGAIGDLATRFFNFAVDLLGQFLGGLVQAQVDVIAFFIGLPGRMIDALGDLFSQFFNVGEDIMNGIIDGLKSLLKKLGDVVGSILGKLNPLGGDFLGTGFGLGDLNPFASGGVIPGRPGEPVPILGHGGEVVLNQGQQAALARLFAGLREGSTTAAAAQPIDRHVEINGPIIVPPKTQDDAFAFLDSLRVEGFLAGAFG